MEFLKSNIEDVWWDLINDYPEFILDLSPFVEEWYENAVMKGYTSLDKSELCNLRYSFECGVGWKDIIREYFKSLKDLIERAKTDGNIVRYSTFIFKEKFGELTDQGNFYGPNYKEYWDDYIKLSNIASGKSLVTCEICGDVGNIIRNNWWKCLCDKHTK
jgi:hypothetical protein